jgi:hypothetical protein
VSRDDAAPPDEEMPDSTRLLQVAWRVVASLAALLALFLVGGFLLPGTWSTERSRTMSLPADSIFPYVDVLARWEEWSPWPGVEIERTGPPRGTGAMMRWDDPFTGDGIFRIVESRGDSLLRYEVRVEGGSIRTDGSFRLQSRGPARTRVTWTESGDFGWNPLLGYAALTMERAQGKELEHGLARLEAVVRTGELPDSLRPPSPPGGPDPGRAPGPGPERAPAPPEDPGGRSPSGDSTAAPAPGAGAGR